MNIIANNKSSKFIYSDSKSVLLALQNKDTSTPRHKTPDYVREKIEETYQEVIN